MNKTLISVIICLFIFAIGFFLGGKNKNQFNGSYKSIVDTISYNITYKDSVIYQFKEKDTTLYSFNYEVIDTAIYKFEEFDSVRMSEFLATKTAKDTISLDSVSVTYDVIYTGELNGLKLGYFYNRPIHQRTIAETYTVREKVPERFSLTLGVESNFNENFSIYGDVNFRGWEIGYRNNLRSTFNGQPAHNLRVGRKIFWK